MRLPKTLKGYINLLNQIESKSISDLKGYERLNNEQKLYLGAISAAIGNNLQDFKEKTNK